MRTDAIDYEVKAVDARVHGALIEEQSAKSIVEFSHYKMLVYTSKNNLYLVANYQVVHKFDDPAKNTNLHQFIAIPDFSELKLPIFIVAGSDTFNLINVKENRMEVLLHHGIKLGSESAFFQGNHKNNQSYSLHFATFEEQGDIRTEKWHKMEFRRDFMDVLMKYGRLPSASIEQ